MFTSGQFYTLNLSRFWLVRDEPKGISYSRGQEAASHKSLLFHISEGDYILTLATVLRFFEDSIKSEEADEQVRRIKLDLIRGVIDDLFYLDENYMLVPKNKISK